MSKFLFRLIILLFVFSCSYQPIFSNKEYNFSFENMYFNGEENIIKILRKELSKSDSQKKYDILIFAEKKREILSSDNKGDPITFKLTISVKFEIMNDGEKILIDKINKQTSYNNIKDKFELSKVEENITTTLTKKISEELLISVSNLKND